MPSVNEYIDKCLAECPAEATELLLGELARLLIERHRGEDAIIIADRSGVVGHLVPALDESEYPELAEFFQQESRSEGPSIPAEVFIAEIQRAIQEEQRLLAGN